MSPFSSDGHSRCRRRSARRPRCERGTVWAGGHYLGLLARARRSDIESTLPGAVRYLSVLASGTTDERDLLSRVADRPAAYGETAAAFRDVLNTADLTGSVDRGLRVVARDTPSREVLAPFLLKLREHAAQGPDAVSQYLELESRMLANRRERTRERAAGFLELVAELFIVLLVLPALLVIVATVLSVLAPGLGKPVATPLGTATVRELLVFGSGAFVLVVGALAALALGYSVVGVAGAFVVGLLVLVVVGFPITVSVTGVRPTLRGSRAEARQFYDHAAPVAMSSLGKVFQNRVDLLLVGALLTAVAAGIYNVVLVLVAIAWIPLLSFNQLLPPVASRLYSDGQVGTLNDVYTSVTRLIVTSVVPIIAVQLVFGREFLALFGPAYVRGYVPLVVYLGGVFVGSAVGATGWLLMMTDHQYARMALDWLLAVLNVALTFLFVREFGLAGAALGTSIAVGVQNFLQALLLRRFEGLWPFDASFLRPIAAGVAMAAVMFAVQTSVDSRLTVAIGVVAGLLAYSGALRVIGIDPRDRLVVEELSSRYRARIRDATQF
ncbi:type II secretion system F family protein [Halobacterium bonnevillei]|uniref:type II secretion system F family protein n=1 Tax=Halobacterium bonnevillei TaxID=2692200 RepID=UPI003742E446